MSALQLSLTEKIRKATALLPPAHLVLPCEKKDIFATQAEAKTRYQNWAFTQGFAVVVEKNDLKHGFYVLECVRHKKETKNSRKKEEGDYVRPASKINAINCRFRLRITWQAETQNWQLISAFLEHNHAMSPDPFVFPQHRDRDPDRQQVETLALGMRTSHTPFGQAKRTLREHGLSIKRKDYYNLQRSAGKRTPETELDRAVRNLELKGFHVRFSEKYHVEGDIRSRRIVEHFFFCNTEQIRLARRFVSSFMIQTDATFNTNQLNLPLSVLVGKSNLNKTFHVAYCVITSESAEAFAFITQCMNDLFFYDNCPGPSVTVGDFSSGLSAEVLRRTKQSRAEAGMQAAQVLADQIQAEGSSHVLQLCSWHAAEAIKKRLITEGYPLEIRKQLVTLIWNWITSPTIATLEDRRNELLSKLRPKEQDYFLGYYHRQESQFIRAYTRHLPNLGVESTQMAESSHGPLKSFTNRHTPISDAVTKIASHIEIMQHELETELNAQRANLPKLMDRRLFVHLAGLVTHATIDLISPELDLAKKWAEKANLGYDEHELPQGEGCIKDCDLPLRYGLPCQCWLFSCVQLDIPIPLSLIHPRWFFDGPAKVAPKWRMTFDLDLTFEIMLKTAEGATMDEELESPYLAMSELDDNQADSPLSVETNDNADIDPKSADFYMGDRYWRKGVDLIEAVARDAIVFHKTLANSQRAEEFAKEFSFLAEKFTSKWKERESARNRIPTTFPDEQLAKEGLTYKKGGSRRRAYTGREAAQAKEDDAHHKQRKRVLEKARMDNHLSLVNATKDDSEVGGIQDAQEEDLHCLDNKRFAFSDNEGGLVSNHPSPSSAIIIPSSPEEFPEVEELYAISQGGRTIRNEVGIAVSTTEVPFTSTAVTTRSSRGVKPRKSKAQLALESQERFERARKSEKQARKEVAQDKNRAKRLEPRKERVSQLLDDFPELLDDEES